MHMGWSHSNANKNVHEVYKKMLFKIFLYCQGFTTPQQSFLFFSYKKNQRNKEARRTKPPSVPWLELGSSGQSGYPTRQATLLTQIPVHLNTWTRWVHDLHTVGSKSGLQHHKYQGGIVLISYLLSLNKK